MLYADELAHRNKALLKTSSESEGPEVTRPEGSYRRTCACNEVLGKQNESVLLLLFRLGCGSHGSAVTTELQMGYLIRLFRNRFTLFNSEPTE